MECICGNDRFRRSLNMPMRYAAMHWGNSKASANDERFQERWWRLYTTIPKCQGLKAIELRLANAQLGFMRQRFLPPFTVLRSISLVIQPP